MTVAKYTVEETGRARVEWQHDDVDAYGNINVSSSFIYLYESYQCVHEAVLARAVCCHHRRRRRARAHREARTVYERVRRTRHFVPANN